MNLRARAPFGLTGLLALSPLLGLAGSAWAQTSAAAEAPTSAAEPAAYQDRVIEGLPPAASGAPPANPYDRSGWARFLRLETRVGTLPFDTSRSTQASLALYGLIDTPNHGAISIDGALTPRNRSGNLTLRQRGMPLGSGWVANHEGGVISAPATDLSRQPGRVYVPSATLLGASGEWRNVGQGLAVVASSGQPGQLQSLPASGFSGLGGRRHSLGAQWRPDGDTSDALNPRLPGWTLALQHDNATGLSGLLPSTAAAGSNATTSANATLFAVRHESDGQRIQAQGITSASNAPAITAIGNASAMAPSAQGFWLDSAWDEGPRTHGLSLYRLDPGLSWAGQPMPNDLQGIALNTAWRTRQWQANGSIDWLRSISGARAAGSYASASARWRLDRNSNIGVGGSLRRFDSNAWSGYGDWRFGNRFGNSGLRLDLAGGDTEQTRSQTLSYDQDWAAPQGWTVSTSVGLGNESNNLDSGLPQSDRFWTLSSAVFAPLGSRANLNGSASLERSQLGRSSHALSLGADWRITPAWTLQANLSRSTGKSVVAGANSLDPLAPIATTSTTSDSDRSFYVVLRYELEAGSRSVPLGGRPFEGGGRIEGLVFYDTNGSGVQEASETGVANALIYLDNRYAVQTDAQGRFEFPLVATGPRTITLRRESLPLPWNTVGEGQTTTDVHLRETTRLMLPVQKN